MTRGVSILVIGQKSNDAQRRLMNAGYIKWMYLLSKSIKYHTPDCKIQLIVNPSIKELLTVQDKIHVNDITDFPDELCYLNDRFSPATAKLNLYPYFKYDETIYLDADTMVINDITPLFQLCVDDYYTSIYGIIQPEQTESNKMLWMDITAMRQKYQLNGNVIPATNSSFQFVRKSKIAEQVFNTAKGFIYDPIPVIDLKMTWGNNRGRKSQSRHNAGQPDELYLNAALATMNLVPGLEIEPLCYKMRSSGRVPVEVIQSHYAISFYGGKQVQNPSILEFAKDKWREMNPTGIPFRVADLCKAKYVDNAR